MLQHKRGTDLQTQLWAMAWRTARQDASKNGGAQSRECAGGRSSTSIASGPAAPSTSISCTAVCASEGPRGGYPATSAASCGTNSGPGGLPEPNPPAGREPPRAAPGCCGRAPSGLGGKDAELRTLLAGGAAAACPACWAGGPGWWRWLGRSLIVHPSVPSAWPPFQRAPRPHADTG